MEMDDYPWTVVASWGTVTVELCGAGLIRADITHRLATRSLGLDLFKPTIAPQHGHHLPPSRPGHPILTAQLLHDFPSTTSAQHPGEIQGVLHQPDHPLLHPFLGVRPQISNAPEVQRPVVPGLAAMIPAEDDLYGGDCPRGGSLEKVHKNRRHHNG
ncbi:hypothetical protein L202_06671 [Cryptococcus amylolentus CBS 6039]|uniref:Uncharacterized protein n=1 Tax=Cryptococcus amylolentus CBS 6039 TaxID=1295533 RepID=A0A1E3HIH8_9TREE|nr:hypothetical protein L202_06671 [Cryptococcus amylolentus CBS 6039]ODN75546.1 hypothetical protein L202_06671 [Cryptococcus amylolentus CBS 6039]